MWCACLRPGFYTATNVYCSVTEARGCEQLAYSCYLGVQRLEVEPTTLSRKSNINTTEPPSSYQL